MGAIIILSTYPDKRSIRKLSNILVKEKLAACVNITKVDSIYTWQNKIECTTEFLAFFKTTNRKKNLLKNRIKKTHPYKVPEIAEIKIKSINKSYLDWLATSTN